MSSLSGIIVNSKIPVYSYEIPVYSYEWLCKKMQDRDRVAIVLHNPAGVTIRGVINGIRPEDGSGRHWLVTINDNCVNTEVYVRTS